MNHLMHVTWEPFSEHNKRDRRFIRVLFAMSILLIAGSYAYRFLITDQSYDRPHATSFIPAVATDNPTQ